MLQHQLTQQAYTHLFNTGLDLDAANREFENLPVQARIDWGSSHFGEDIALISSFGPQSLLTLYAVLQSAPDASIIHIDIAEERFEVARRYRDFLSKTLNFQPLIIKVPSEEKKQEYTRRALRDAKFKAVFRGTRRSQTPERSHQKFIEPWHDGLLAVSPILDWSDRRVEKEIEGFYTSLQHPEYQPGVRAKGGVVLRPGQEKTECGLHLTHGAGI